MTQAFASRKVWEVKLGPRHKKLTRKEFLTHTRKNGECVEWIGAQQRGYGRCGKFGPAIEAINRLESVGPNGRDYYPQGPDALGAAVREHDARVAKLRSVYAELGWLTEQIDQIRR